MGRKSILRDIVSSLSFSLPDSHNEHQDFLVKHLINQSVACAFELHFVAVREFAKPVGIYPRVFENLCELLLNCWRIVSPS